MDVANNVVVYTGTGGAEVPDDVVCVVVDPSVTSIPAHAFFERRRLTEVELCEGIVEIGNSSFAVCHQSITKINIPNSLRRIKDYAFAGSLRTPIQLHDGIESIGTNAFGSCIFTNFRVPPLITMIPDHMLYGCRATFSLELPRNVMVIGLQALAYCYSLRNVAFPPNAVIDEDGEGSVIEGSDLQRLFGLEAEIIRELKHRFDGLPIHSLLYYQSYNQRVLHSLISAINSRSGHCWSLCSKLDPTGNHQDCLGMTPLHILTCSSVHNLEVYRVVIENYPTNLITEDRWGALPLLYAFWGAAPREIIQCLLDSYQSLYPDHIFNWTMMVETMGRTDTPKESIENLLWVKQVHFPSQPIDWDHLLDQFASSSLHSSFKSTSTERMRYLFNCCMSDHVEALRFKVWRDHITNMIYTANFEYNGDNFGILNRIQEKVAYFEDELPKLKEIMTILELALWKLRMNEKIPEEEATRYQKKIKTDESSMRRQCRITCGADVVIGHVLPFLITA